MVDIESLNCLQGNTIRNMTRILKYISLKLYKIYTTTLRITESIFSFRIQKYVLYGKW